MVSPQDGRSTRRRRSRAGRPAPDGRDTSPSPTTRVRGHSRRPRSRSGHAARRCGPAAGRPRPRTVPARRADHDTTRRSERASARWSNIPAPGTPDGPAADAPAGRTAPRPPGPIPLRQGRSDPTQRPAQPLVPPRSARRRHAPPVGSTVRPRRGARRRSPAGPGVLPRTCDPVDGVTQPRRIRVQIHLRRRHRRVTQQLGDLIQPPAGVGQVAAKGVTQLMG